MFKKIKLAVLLLCCTSTVCVGKGIKENFRAIPFSQGWFVGPGIGTQFYVGDSDNLKSTGYRFSTAMEGWAGKWITSSLALRLQGTAARVTGGNIRENRDAMNMVNTHIDLIADAINFIAGVKEERTVTFLPFLGVGCAANVDNKVTCFSLNVGATALFRVNRKINLFAELKGALLNDKMDGSKGGSRGEGSAVLSAGFVYNIGSSRK